MKASPGRRDHGIKENLTSGNRESGEIYSVSDVFAKRCDHPGRSIFIISPFPG
jgi:hypothetical protein